MRPLALSLPCCPLLPGGDAARFTGPLRRAPGSRPRMGSWCLLFAWPRWGAALAPRCTRSGPCDGIFPCGSLRRRSRAACAAVVWLVWTRSLTRPVSRAVRASTKDLAGAPGLFGVDADTSPFEMEDATPGSHVGACVCVLFFAGLGGLASRATCGSPHHSCGHS